MKRKLRIFSNIAIICLSICMFAFGVYAASTVSVTTSGTVSFTATGVYAKVSGEITECAEVTAGNTTGLTMEDITLGSTGVISGNVSTWANKEISFNSNNVATISVTVTNLAEDRPLYVTVYDQTTDNKINTAMKLGTEDILAATVTKVEASANVTFTIQMSPADLNTSFEADYQYLIDLDATNLDEDTIDDKLVVGTNNSELGTVTKSFNGNYVTLTAAPTSGNSFLGYVIGNPNNGHFVFANPNEVGTNTLTETINLSILDNRAIYGVFYSDRVLNYVEDTNTISIVYVGTNYASVSGGDISTDGGLTSINAYISSAGQIVEKVEYQGKEYNVALLEKPYDINGLGNAGCSIFYGISEIVLPEHISAFKDDISNSYCYSSSGTVFYSKNLYYAGNTVMAYDGTYINNKYMLSTLTSFNQISGAGELVKLYINNNIIFEDISPFLCMAFPTSTTTTKNGETYIKYTNDIYSASGTIQVETEDKVWSDADEGYIDVEQWCKPYYMIYDSGFAVYCGHGYKDDVCDIPETITHNGKTYIVKGINSLGIPAAGFDANTITIPKTVEYIYKIGYFTGTHNNDIVVNIHKGLKEFVGVYNSEAFLNCSATINFEGTEAEWDAIINSATVESYSKVTKVNFNVSMD